MNLIIASAVLTAAFLQTPAMQPAPIDADLLAGPGVDEDKAATTTIVHRNFDGTLQPLDTDPDAAAIDLLDLTPAQREAFDKLRADRTAAFDKLVRSNYGLIIELASLRGQTDPAERIELLGKTRKAFATYIQRGSFLDEFASQLTTQQRIQVDAMLVDYRQARADELRPTMGPDAPPRRIAQRARLEAFGQMVRQSIERQVGLEKQNFEQLAQELDLTEEQKAKAQAIFGPLAVQRLQDKPVDPAERAKAVREFSKMLTPEQRRRLFAMLVQQWRSTSNTDASDVKGQAPIEPMSSDR